MWSPKSEMDMLSRFKVAIWWCAQIVLILSIKCIRCVVDSTKKDFDKISEFLILSIIIIIKSFDQNSKFIGKCQEINEDMSPPQLLSEWSKSKTKMIALSTIEFKVRTSKHISTCLLTANGCSADRYANGLWPKLK